ncbi:hypothetical protein IAR50_001387 [Cryptococcus sp. DSM 104548]
MTPSFYARYSLILYASATTLSESQRRLKTTNTFDFWKVFFWVSQTNLEDLVRDLARGYIITRARCSVYVSVPAASYQKRETSDWTEEGRRIMSSPQAPTFRNYRKRAGLEEQGYVAYNHTSCRKEDFTRVELGTIYSLANLVAARGAFDHSRSTAGQTHYVAAPRLISGTLDIDSRPKPDEANQSGNQTQAKVATKLGVEMKGITIVYTDKTLTFFVLGLLRKYRLLSAPVKDILAQLNQEMHVDRAEYVMLATHDVAGEPTGQDRYEDSRRIVENMLQYQPPEVSVLEVLVGGLFVPVPEEMKAVWLNLPEASLTSVDEGHPPSADGIPTAGGPSAPSYGQSTGRPTPGLQGGNTAVPSAGFNLSVKSSLIDVAFAPIHPLPNSELPEFSWRVHPAFRPAPDSASPTGVDVPSLTTSDGSSTNPSLLQTPAPGRSVDDEVPIQVLQNAADDAAISQMASIFTDYPLRLSPSGEKEELEARDSAETFPDPNEKRPKLALVDNSSCTQTSPLVPSPKGFDLTENVQIFEYIGHGQLWDSYRGTRTTREGTSTVVIKFCNILDYLEISPDEDRWYSQSQAEHHISNKIDILCNHSELLRGRGKGCHLVAIVMEDCGQPWPYFHYDDVFEPVMEDLTKDEQDSIIAAYTDIHNHGILHKDVSAGHITKHPVDGAPRILDFEGAEYLGPEEQKGRAREYETEMERVRWMVGQAGAGW